ncbi:diguanylate cyclase domain-containing protein [Kineococcus gynurae]|uniref:Diguanylate cyclase domain-containing protein n=1 Tax=Kineococcus gynurae TaxID=452979 RepID=A0ABV5LMP6_9ACTN
MRRLRPDVWQLLMAAVAVLTIGIVTIVLTGPRAPAEPPASAVADVFATDIANAPRDRELATDPDRMTLAQQLDADTATLLASRVVTAVTITRDGIVLVDAERAVARGARSEALDAVVVSRRVGDSQDGVYRIEVHVAEPVEVSALRWRSTVLQLLVVALGVLAAGGLWVSRRRHQETEQMTLVDPLTGVGNRRLLERLTHRVLRHPEDLRLHALLLLDIDHFKTLNDTLGHAHGDLALRRLAEALLDAVRPGDHVIRLGGDEFAVLLEDVPPPPGSDALAAQVLQRVRDSVPDLGISGGSAVWPVDAPDLAGLTELADRAMYADKQARRRVDAITAAPSGAPRVPLVRLAQPCE